MFKILSILPLGISTLLLVPSAARAADPLPPSGLGLDGAVSLGYAGGAGIQLSSVLTGIAVELPLDVRLGVGFASVAPGSAAGARRVFINNATNGVPEKQGHVWDLRMDFLYPIGVPGIPRADVVIGPRYSQFVGNFRYVGGNEDFDVTSTQWGVGAGLEARFPIRGGFDLVLGGGYDYFAESRLQGHDTAYEPGGDHVNPRQDYTYESADGVISQPKHEVRGMMGLRFGLWRPGS